ncbi:50S ribosomal protein L29 [Candidatus Woesearchaeota archaeon]|nr:50S ribosomal protein L29 [Candidatus Woesearchaeota archaeon]
MKVTKDLREMAVTELKVKLAESKKELLKLNVQVAAGTHPSSPGKVKKTKKNIARMNTILQEKGGLN